MKRLIANANNLFARLCILHTVHRQTMPYYAVAAGKEIGIFDTWANCEAKVKGYPGAKYKKFNNRQEAESYLKEHGAVVKPRGDSFDPKDSAVALSSKVGQSKAFKAAAQAINKEVKPKVIVEEKWPDEFECSEADNSFLLAAVAEVEGTSESTTATKRPLVDNTSTKSSKLAKLEHKSIVWEPIGLKKIGNFEFPIDREGYVIVYTDGSCINNGKRNPVAGYGVYFAEGHALSEKNAAKPVKGRVTNNAGEIQAAIHAIQVAKDFGIQKLCLSTDSQFLINAVTAWISGWKRRGWKLANGDPVKNVDDFQTLDELLDGTVDVKWNYVRGHKGIEGNEKADELARMGAVEYRVSVEMAKIKKKK